MNMLLKLPNQLTHPGSGYVCGECIHAVRPHRYRQDWLYCKITPSSRTRFGIAKIKARQKACARFTENMKSPLAICPLCGLPRNSLDTPCPKCQHEELVYAVSRKFVGETRHETALRYIREAELRSCDGVDMATDSTKENK